MFKKYYLFVILLFLTLPSLELFSNEKDNSEGLIRIEQKSKTKFRFYQGDKRLYSKTKVLEAMSDIPKVANLYEIIHKKYVGMNVMMGLGIGFAATSSYVFLFFLLSVLFDFAYFPSYYTYDTANIITNYSFWGTIGSGASLIASIVMWVIGARYRVYFRVKRADAVKLYNKKKKKINEEESDSEISIWFKPDINFNNDMTPNIRVAFSVSF